MMGIEIAKLILDLQCIHRTNGLLCPKCRYNPKTYLDQKR